MRLLTVEESEYRQTKAVTQYWQLKKVTNDRERDYWQSKKVTNDKQRDYWQLKKVTNDKQRDCWQLKKVTNDRESVTTDSWRKWLTTERTWLLTVEESD